MNAAWWLNSVWMLRCSGEARAFHRATGRVADAQAEVLAEILRCNRDTDFGRRYGFSRLDGPRAYREHVPHSRYDDYADAIRRIGEGERGVLTRDPVRLLEPTSGSTGGEKLIPFTASLRRQFQRAVSAWVFDLFRHRPALRRGRAFWSVSPAVAAGRRTACGIPIGFEDDAAYVGAAQRWLIQRLLVVPSEACRLSDVESFQYCTLWFLLRAADLASISVWNPTFLTSLLAPLEAWHDRLCFDLRRGRPEPPTPLPPELPRRFAAAAAGRRAKELQTIFGRDLPWPEKLRLIWPKLALISCWADAGAGRYFELLRSLFPTVEFQPKGLLATEGCVSLPLLGRPGAVLAVRSHFFEFQPVDAPREIRLAHELERGGRYCVILTTGGGLYRYELRDEIEVVGFENQCPLLRFVGKADCISDLVGEKVSEPHVRAVLHALFERHCLRPSFALVVPVESPPRYRLYVQAPTLDVNLPLLETLAAELDDRLSENPHYGYARRIGQLAPVEVLALLPHGEPGWDVYRRECIARGMRWGDIKPLLLDARPGWPTVFERFV
jgi:hypothetical protein